MRAYSIKELLLIGSSDISSPSEVIRTESPYGADRLEEAVSPFS